MFWSGWVIVEKTFLALLVGYAVFVVYSMVARRRMSFLDLTAGSWFLVWVDGLVVLSYLGDIDPGAPAAPGIVLDGGDGPIGLGWGVVVLAVFSAAVYAWVVALRLPTHRTAAYVSNLPSDEPEKF